MASFNERVRPLPRRKVSGIRGLERGHWYEGVDWRALLGKVLILLSLLLLTLWVFPDEEVPTYSARIGEPWAYETLTAPFDFPVYRDAETIATLRAEAIAETPWIFRIEPGSRVSFETQIAQMEDQLLTIFDAFAASRIQRQRGNADQADADSLRGEALLAQSPIKMGRADWNPMIEDYARRVPGLSDRSNVTRTSLRIDERITAIVLDVGRALIEAGVLSIESDSVASRTLIVRNLDTRTQREVDPSSYIGLNEAYRVGYARIDSLLDDSDVMQRIAHATFSAAFRPNIMFEAAETGRVVDEALRYVAPTDGIVRKGEVIVDAEEVIDETSLRKIDSLQRAIVANEGDQLYWRLQLGRVLLVLAVYGFFFIYLFNLRRRLFDDNRALLSIVVTFMLMVVLLAIASRTGGSVVYVVPICIASVLLTVMHDSRVGLFATICLAILGGHLLGFDFTYAWATIFAGSLGVLSVRDIKNRAQFFISAGIVFGGYLLVITAVFLLRNVPLERYLTDMMFVGVNSFLLILAYPLLWIYERAFAITTDLTLIELSDTNKGVLKELSLRAPGSFNHSLQVANLAEAAADSVGANALLTRVGALYHDIGKMAKPEYFVENQRSGINPHDGLRPRMSALIIASHVKEGLELAQQYRIPAQVTDFIPMHHGTTRIEYFYQTAKQEAAELADGTSVEDVDYRYPGPRPNTKEAGILMLADGVEAASRAMKNPTHKRLEGVIEAIIEARMDDRQLDETALTFRDLSRIKETFLSMLTSIYHVRVQYPGQTQDDDTEESAPRGGLDTRSQAESA